jgi:two-component system phosphate regulon sensor histidine kinase PhoR
MSEPASRNQAPAPWHAMNLERALANGSGAMDVALENLFEQFADADHRGLILVGERRTVLAMNPAARNLLAYDGPLPRSAAEISHDIEFEFAIGDAIHDRRPVWHESYAPRPDRLLSFHLVPILSPNGEPRLVGATVEDVTRLRQLETVRRDFVANVSHELRTPIASINLLVETLQRGALNDQEAALRFLHRIEVETQAMAHMVEELLELSRLETGALTLDVAATDLELLVRDVLTRLAPTAEEKEVSLVADIRHELPEVRADRKRIEQVLMNLVHNGIKFTPAGGRVTVRASRQGLAVSVEVVDTGVGMDAGQAARIFERFYKVDKGRNRSGGSGLGLAISKHLLDLHRSSLQVVSEVGRGSKFSFSLPAVE